MVDEDIYRITIKRINKYVKKEVRSNKKWLNLGMMFGCFTCGFSILPISFRYRKVINISQSNLQNETNILSFLQIIDGIESILYDENISTYHELGLHWKLCDDVPDTAMKNLLVGLVIEFIPASQ